MQYQFDNNISIYLQLVDQLQIAIISGRLLPGTKLPSIRELALQTKVNPNTVQKALVELEQLKLIYTERTNGKYVTTDTLLISNYKKNYAISLTNNYFTSMANIGFTKEETLKQLQELGGEK